MKYCPKCGTELADENAYCSKCGAWQYAETQGQPHYNPPQQKPPYNKGVTTLNKVFLVLACAQIALIVVFAILFTSLASNWSEDMYHSMVEAGFTFSPDTPNTGLMVFTFLSVYLWILSLSAGWIVPMTINYFKKTKENKPTTLVYKICTLIFVNFIAGLLMLCCEQNADKQNTTNEQARDTF